MDPAWFGAAAKVMRALAHPIRLGVLQCLAAGEKRVTDLHRELGCSQSAMSQQIGILEAQGLVSTRKVGTQKYCALGNPEFVNLLHCLEAHLARVAARPFGTLSGSQGQSVTTTQPPAATVPPLGTMLSSGRTP